MSQGYSSDKIDDRGDLTEDDWLENIPKRTLAGTVPNVDNLAAVYIDTFYRKSDPTQDEKFKENTKKLFKFATEKKTFYGKDIKSFKHELRIKNLRLLVQHPEARSSATIHFSKLFC